MKPFKVLLTDLDGTLVHSEDCICDALRASFLHMGVTVPSKEAIMDMFGLPVEVMLTRLTEVEESDKERINGFIAEYKRQYPIHMAGAVLIGHALDTLRYICGKGIPICLITSERRKNAEYILQRLGLSTYIQGIISRDDVTKFKPDKEPIVKGASLFGAAPEECVYIGEAPYDMQAGVSAGVYTVAVPSGSWSGESLLACKPALMIEDIEELQNLF